MRAVALAALLPLAGAARAQDAADPWTACRRPIAEAERGVPALPPGLLRAIAVVESGRADAASGRFEPWPWTINAEGEGRFFATRGEAVAAAEALRARGARSVDTGCLPVNLLHHPGAFASLDAAFGPVANARYAARLLLALRAGMGEWPAAIARCHSGDAARGAGYQRRVALARLGQAWGGAGGSVELPRDALAGLCAPGLRPALVVPPARGGARGGGARQPRMVCRRRGARSFALVVRSRRLLPVRRVNWPAKSKSYGVCQKVAVVWHTPLAGSGRKAATERQHRTGPSPCPPSTEPRIA